MQILDSLYDLSDELGCHSLRESTLALEPGVDLSLGSELENQIEGVVVLVVIKQLHDVLVVELVHDLDFELDLLDQVVLDNLGLVDDLDSVNVLGQLVAHFVNFTEATDADVRVGQRLEVIFATLAFLPVGHTGRQEEDPALHCVNFAP